MILSMTEGGHGESDFWQLDEEKLGRGVRPDDKEKQISTPKFPNYSELSERGGGIPHPRF